METVIVNASKTYEVKIGNGLLDKSGEHCSKVISGNKVLLLTDSNIAPLYLNTVKASFEDSDFTVYPYIITAGEASKNTDNLIKIVTYLAQEQFTKTDAIVALGGGVVGDLAGFCAATYLRGIGFIQIPTTLLACVDSSVGGKTAVNLTVGKNLFGAFYQPDLVLCDPNTLNTLPNEIYADGMAEVIKYGMIWDEEFFSKLEQKELNNSAIIKHCVTIKSEIVSKDETDKGQRQILNFGHTIGHAIEKLSSYTISHGSAVSIGMAIISRALVNSNQLKLEQLNRLLALLESYNLPTGCNYSCNELYNAALSDKKRSNDKINLVTVPEIGTSQLSKINISELENYIKAGLQ